MKRTFLVVLGMLLVSFTAHAQTVGVPPLVFRGPKIHEHLAPATQYTFVLNRLPSVSGKYSVRGADGFLYGTLEGTTTSQISYVWNVGQYATGTERNLILDSHAEYYVTYSDNAGRILAKSPLFYLEPASSVKKSAVAFSFNGSAREERSGAYLKEAGGVSYHQGVKGDAIVFNGTSGIASGDLPGPKFSRPSFTLAAWIKPEANHRSDFPYIAGLWPVGARGPSYGLLLDNGRPRFTLGSGTTSPYWLAGEPLEVDEWHHVAFSVARASNGLVGVVMYLDGVPEDVTYVPNGADATFSPAPYEGVFAVGGDALKPASNFAGAVDELHLFNAALSGEDVAELYDNERPNRRVESVSHSAPRSSLALFSAIFGKPLRALFDFSW